MFKVGDRVMLRSGGPVMTVSSAQHEDALECTWFNEKKEVARASFAGPMLRAIPDDDD